MLTPNSTIYHSFRSPDVSDITTTDNYCLPGHLYGTTKVNRKIKAYLYQIAERFDVVLKKSSQGFGLTLVDDLMIDNLKLLKVKAIYKDGPAAKCGIIQPGDILSAFNKINIIGVQPDDVIKMFKVIKEKESIILTVWKIAQKPLLKNQHSPTYDIINFYLQKCEGGFGFILGNFKDEHQVAKVNGTGDVQLLLQANDKIISIGRVRIENLSHDQVVNLLKKFPKSHYLQFTIMRDLTGMIRSSSNENCQNMDYSMNSSIYSKISRNTDPHFYHQMPGIGTSGPCNTPDFIPVTHFLSLNHHDSTRLFQSANYDSVCHIPSSYSTSKTNMIDDLTLQPDFIPESFTESTSSLSQSPEIFSVQLTRSPSKGFGFRLMGGSEEGCQVYVGAIIPQGPVDKCGLIHCGDIITEINNTSTERKTHSEVVNLLDEAAKTTNGILNLTLIKNNPVKRKSTSYNDCRTIFLTRKPEEGFGFVIVSAVNPTEPCGIGRVNPGSVADLCGQLHLGDRILSVNGHDLQGLHYKDVLKIIKHSDLSIQLTVRDGDINRLKTIKYELPNDSEKDSQFQEKCDIVSEFASQPVSIMKSTSQFDKQMFKYNHKVIEEIQETNHRSLQEITHSTISDEIQTIRDPSALLIQRR